MKNIKTWWFLLVAGLILIFVGIFSFIAPFTTYLNLAKYSGYILLLNGALLSAVSTFHTTCKREKNWVFFESILDLGFGAILLFNPVFTFIAFPFIIGYWIAALGIIKIAASIALMRQVRGWPFILLTGVLATFFGLLIVNLPLEKLDNITQILGCFGMTMGALTLFDAYRFRKLDDTLNLLF